jgi:hypothetical protein
MSCPSRALEPRTSSRLRGEPRCQGSKHSPPVYPPPPDGRRRRGNAMDARRPSHRRRRGESATIADGGCSRSNCGKPARLAAQAFSAESLVLAKVLAEKGWCGAELLSTSLNLIENGTSSQGPVFAFPSNKSYSRMRAGAPPAVCNVEARFPDDCVVGLTDARMTSRRMDTASADEPHRPKDSQRTLISRCGVTAMRACLARAARRPPCWARPGAEVKFVTVPPDCASPPSRLGGNVVMRTVSLIFSIC